ncbi:MAG: hypothetical protein WC227_02635 [Patescibacteria group bacterium]|jgi:hypothetical protein
MEKFLQLIHVDQISHYFSVGIKSLMPTSFNAGRYEIFILIILIFALASAVDFFLVRSFFGKNYRLFVAPGVIIHEMSHFLACLLTGAKVTKVVVFDTSGGSVEHEKPRIPVIGQVLISFAPFIIGTGIIYFMSLHLGLKPVNLKEIDLSVGGILSYAKSMVSPINFADWKNWLIFYIVLNVIVTMTPSKQDFKNMALLLILILVVLVAAFKFLPMAGYFSFVPVEKITILLSSIVLLLIFALLFSIVLFAVSKIFKK